MRKLIALLGLLALVAVANNAQAAKETSTVDVVMTIEETCAISFPNNTPLVITVEDGSGWGYGVKVFDYATNNPDTIITPTFTPVDIPGGWTWGSRTAGVSLVEGNQVTPLTIVQNTWSQGLVKIEVNGVTVADKAMIEGKIGTIYLTISCQ